MPHDADLPLRPVVEIDLDALAANYEFLRALAQGAETAAVVKCDAYGLGAGRIGKTLAGLGCRSFFVAYPEEGAALRRAIGNSAASSRIYIFNGPDPASLPLFASSDLTPILNTLEQARLWAASGEGAPCAIHIDTGMNRLGLPPEDVDAAAAIAGLNVVLAMSHLSCSSEPGNSENAAQREAFVEIARRFPNARRSIAASGGAMIGPERRFDLIRPGAALYGVSPFDAPEARLRPVARLTAPVVQIRHAPKGRAVGYGAAARLNRDSTLATVLLGYGDGVHRAAGSSADKPGGEAVLRGRRCGILGRVSMDLIVLDATDVLGLALGDRAEFFGPAMPIDQAAAASGTIGYELLTSLGPRVLRRYVSGGRG